MKYKEGLVAIGIEGCIVFALPPWLFALTILTGVIVPNPIESWTPAHRKALCALTILFSYSWAFEMYCFNTRFAMVVANSRAIHFCSIVHLGELCRWLFLFNSMSEALWLKSKYMHAWVVGSVVVALYMPIVAGIGCKNAMRVSFDPCCRCSGLIVLTVPIMDVRGGRLW